MLRNKGIIGIRAGEPVKATAIVANADCKCLGSPHHINPHATRLPMLDRIGYRFRENQPKMLGNSGRKASVSRAYPQGRVAVPVCTKLGESALACTSEGIILAAILVAPSVHKVT